MFKALQGRNDEMLVFLLSLSWLSFHWFSSFPALYSWDIFYYVKSIYIDHRKPGSMYWESFLYEIYVYLMAVVSPRMTLATFFQIFLFSLLSVRIFGFIKIQLKMPRFAYLILIIFLLAPPNIYFTLLTERDNLSTWAGCFGMILLAQVIMKNNSNKMRNDFLKIFSFFAMMSALRKEAAVILFILPLLFYFRLKVNFKRILVAYVFTTVCVIVYSQITQTLSVDQTSGLEHKYNVSGVASTFLYIAAKNKDQLSLDDRDFLFSFINPKILDAPETALNSNIAELEVLQGSENLKRFYSLAIKLFAQYPFDFLYSRFAIYFNYFRVPMYFSPVAQLGPNKFAFEKPWGVRDNYNMIAQNILPHFKWFFKFFFESAHSSNTFLFAFANPTWSIAICFVCLLFFRFAPVSATLAVLPLCHCFIVFLFQPALGTKYLYFTYISVFLIISVFIFEIRSKMVNSNRI